MYTFASKSAVLCNKNTYLSTIVSGCQTKRFTDALSTRTQATIIYHKCVLFKRNIVSIETSMTKVETVKIL